MRKNIYDQIKKFNDGRDPFFLALKYDKMMDNAFSFFRGTCHLFYEDLAKKPPLEDDTKVWICGDLHIENFGRYLGNDSRLHYDIEDFDEAVLAPVTWEILRTITSIHLAMEQLGSDKETEGLPLEKSKALANHFLKTYIKVIDSGKPHAIKCQSLLDFVTPPVKSKSPAFTVAGERATINIDKPTSDKSKRDEISTELKQEISETITSWLRENGNMDEVLDAARRIAGTGSLGIDRYMVLVRRSSGQEHYLLDVKRSTPSSVARFVQSIEPAIRQPNWDNESSRIIEIQEKMQGIEPQFILQTNRRQLFFQGNSYVLKELQPEADRIVLADLVKAKQSLKDILADYAIMTASAHLRAAGHRGSSDIDILRGFFKIKRVEKSILDYCIKYAKNVKDDHAAFKADVDVWQFIRKNCGLVKKIKS